MKLLITIRQVLFASLIATSVYADPSINSGTIVEDTLSALPNCLHYQVPVQFCVWVNEYGKINTTPVLDHYSPDLVVSVFSKPHDNPWFEVNKILDSVGQPIQQGIVHGVTDFSAGSGDHSFQDAHEQNIILKEADVIGNPALSVIPSHGLLPSTASPWSPYFESMADSLLWRGLPPMALPEEGLALGLNVMHHVGTGITDWGGIYPHEGKVINDNDAKASMVIAARASDLLTGNYNFGHLYQRLSISCGQHCDAAPIKENSKETYFQMIYPITQNDCHILGDGASYNSSMLNNAGSYVWIVWRHYKGCADGDGKYIGRI